MEFTDPLPYRKYYLRDSRVLWQSPLANTSRIEVLELERVYACLTCKMVDYRLAGNIIHARKRSGMAEEYNFKGVGETCGVCEKIFEEEESLFSALRRDTEEYARLDFCVSCWEGRDGGGFLCSWKRKTRVRETQPTVDGSVVFEIFQRLDGAEEKHDRNFRYILGLLLMRRKRLKFVDVEKTENGEFLVLEDKQIEDVKYRLLDPGMSEEEIQHAKDEVGKLFSINIDSEDSEKEKEDDQSDNGVSEVHQS